MADYDKDPVVFDERGLKEILCVKCGAIVVRRSEAPSKRFAGYTNMVMMRLSNDREVKIELSDGSVTFLHFCQQCLQTGTIDDEKAVDSMKKGWELELGAARRSAQVIEDAKAGWQGIISKKRLDDMKAQGDVPDWVRQNPKAKGRN